MTEGKGKVVQHTLTCKSFCSDTIAITFADSFLAANATYILATLALNRVGNSTIFLKGEREFVFLNSSND